jgi:peptide/nickel transport system permease protein
LLKYTATRVARLFVIVLGALTIMFLLQRLSGDPITLILPDLADEQQAIELRQELGLDRPVYVQYGLFVGNALTGDFGVSYIQGQPVLDVVLQRLPATLKLAAFAVILASVGGTLLGALGALWRGRIADRLLVAGSLLGQSIPTFWLGIMFILFFAVRLRWFPASGDDTWRHIVLPGVTLASFSLARTTRIARASMIEALSQDYVRTARAKGASELRVVAYHALKNASISVVTVTAFMFSTLIGGAIVTEVVFAWPGVGRLIVDSVLQRDFPVVQGAVFVTALIVATTYMLLDIVYRLIDPRIGSTG